MKEKIIELVVSDWTRTRKKYLILKNGASNEVQRIIKEANKYADEVFKKTFNQKISLNEITKLWNIAEVNNFDKKFKGFLTRSSKKILQEIISFEELDNLREETISDEFIFLIEKRSDQRKKELAKKLRKK